MPPFLLPSPICRGRSLWLNRAEIARHAGFTLTEVVLGFVLGSGIGAALAVAMGFSARLTGVLRPILTFSQTIPVFALGADPDPVAGLWHGAQDRDDGADRVLSGRQRHFWTGWAAPRRRRWIWRRSWAPRAGGSCAICASRPRCRSWRPGCGWRRSMPRSAR
jgi:hypothetical protein